MACFCNEVAYRALASCSTELHRVHNLLHKLPITLSKCYLFISQSCVSLTHETRHWLSFLIDIMLLVVRSKSYISYNNQLADALTKSLASPTVPLLHPNIGVLNGSSILQDILTLIIIQVRTWHETIGSAINHLAEAIFRLQSRLVCNVFVVFQDLCSMYFRLGPSLISMYTKIGPSLVTYMLTQMR